MSGSRTVPFTEADRAAMRAAIEVARRGEGRTSPNPCVGALLVDRRGRPIAEGWHARFGSHHAERVLLEHVGGRRIPSDAVLYLTLEPCAHRGKTPPCVDALLESSIRRFVIASRDPDPRRAGRGIRALRAAGREVRVGLLRDDARELNRPFFLAMEEGRARVTLKIASTLDGQLADEDGRSKWITGPSARREVARLREASDAVVVGSGTVETDDPRLHTRSRSRAPSRIVIAGRLDFDPDCRLARIWRAERGRRRERQGVRLGNWVGITTGSRVGPKGAAPRTGSNGTVSRTGSNGTHPPGRWIRSPRLIVATADEAPRRRDPFLRRGWEVWPIPDRSGRAVDLTGLARKACEEGLLDLLVEPGPRLASAFVETGPVDRILLFLAPAILGGGRGWTSSMTALPLPRAMRGAIVGPPAVHGPDVLIEFVNEPPAGGVKTRRRIR